MLQNNNGQWYEAYKMWRPSASITCLALWASSAPSSSAFAPRARRHSRTPALQLLALAPSLDDVAAIASIAGPMIAFGNIVDSAALFSLSSLLDAAAASPSSGGIFDAGRASRPRSAWRPSSRSYHGCSSSFSRGRTRRRSSSADMVRGGGRSSTLL